MRKILLTTALVLPLSGFAFAQTTTQPAPETTPATAAEATTNAAEATADAAAETAENAAEAANDAADAATDAAIDAGTATADAAAETADAAADAADNAAETAADAADAAAAESPEAAAAAALEAEMATSDKIAREQAMNELRIDWVTGANVTSPTGDAIGSVRDVIVDAQSGQIIAAIIGVGGFLGIGEKQIAVPWDQLTINYDAQEITTGLTKDEAKAAPEYVFREREAAPAPMPAADPAAAPADPAAVPADPAAPAPAN